MNDLTSKQRAFLMSIASKEKTVIQIGKDALSPSVTDAVDEALAAREIVKVGVQKTCPGDLHEIPMKGRWRNITDPCADIPDRNRIDGGDHLNRFQVPDLLQRLAKGIPERGKLIPLHRKQASLRKAVRSFKKHAGDYKLFIGYSAIIDTAGR